MQIKSPRFAALATLSVLATSALLQPAPAHADNSKKYKYGAVALGVLGGVLIAKGKTTEGAIALGAGGYAYKKGEDARKANKDDRYYGYNYGDSNRYGQYSSAPIYPDARDNATYNDNRSNDNRYAERSNRNYRLDARNNGNVRVR